MAGSLALLGVGGTGQGTDIMRQATLMLTHAQILTLPTTPVTLVAAPGAGLIIHPLSAVYISDTRAAVYTNVDPGMALRVSWNGETHTVRSFSQEFNSNGNVLTFPGLQYYPMNMGTVNDGTGNVFEAGDETVYFVNLPLRVRVTNGALGNLTGGDPANSLRVSVFYVLFDVTTGLFS